MLVSFAESLSSIRDLFTEYSKLPRNNTRSSTPSQGSTVPWLIRMVSPRSSSPPLTASLDLTIPSSLTGIHQGIPCSEKITGSSTRTIKSIPVRQSTSLADPQDPSSFSKFTLFPKLPIEVRLMVWRYSIPRFIRQPTKSYSQLPLFDTLKEAFRVAKSKREAEMLLSKINKLIHTLDIPCFNLLNVVVARKIRKAREEFSEWMGTTDTIALTINVCKYTQLLGCGVRRIRLIGDSLNSVIRVLPPNIKVLLIIFDYNTSTDNGKEALLSDIDPACDPNLKPIQKPLSDALSLAFLLHRFEVKYKEVGRDSQYFEL